MQTVDRLSPTSAVLWLRAVMGRLGRTMSSGRPVVRLGVALALGLGLAAAGYWATSYLGPAGNRYLDSGRSFASQDLLKIGRALRAKGIEYRVDDRKVEVVAEQYEQASLVYAHLDIGPRPFDEIRDLTDSWSLWDTPEQREWKHRLGQERFLEAIINKLDGVVSSLVSIQYPRGQGSWRRGLKASAFVYLETEANRPLPSRTVQLIPAILMGNQPDLSHETITLVDGEGHRYFDPRNPSVGELSRDRAREEEIRDEILDKLSWIKGLQVWVQLLDGRAGAGGPLAAPVVRPRPDHTEQKLAVSVNEPMQLEDPGHPALPPLPAAVAIDPKVAGRGDGTERGRILINVPRSFYYNAIVPRGDRRDPSAEELHGMAVRIREQVLKRVKLVVSDSWTVDVDTVPDDVPVGRLAALPAGPDARRKVIDWGIVASIVAAVAIVTALGSWIQAARRPARLSEPADDTRHYRADFAAEPGPTERVRELVRRDPEAAASVLQRWTAPGGRVS
jgi:hypothetical protein